MNQSFIFKKNKNPYKTIQLFTDQIILFSQVLSKSDLNFWLIVYYSSPTAASTAWIAASGRNSTETVSFDITIYFSYSITLILIKNMINNNVKVPENIKRFFIPTRVWGVFP